MASSRDGLVQLFFDSGRGFQEEDSRLMSLRKSDSPIRYRFSLPTTIITKLRLDPNNGGGTFIIKNAQIVKGTGTELLRLPLTSFEPNQQIQSATVANDTLTIVVADDKNDPYLVADLKPPILPWWKRLNAIQFSKRTLALTILVAWIALYLALLIDAAVTSHFPSFAGMLSALARERPRLAIVTTAMVATIISVYPVVFAGKSFVSPNNGPTAQLFSNPPYVPGDDDPGAEDVRGSDVGAMMWEARPYSAIQSRTIFTDREFPLWNRFSSAGVPLLGQGQSMIGDPLHLLTVATGGAAWSWDVKFVIAKFLFCTGLGLLAFQLTGCLTSGIVLAASSAFLGFFLFRINHMAFFSVCYAPWILIGWAGILKTQTLREARPFVLVLVLAVIMVLNSGTVKEAYILTIFLNLTGMLAFLLKQESLIEKLRKGWILLAAGLSSLLTTAPFWWVFKDEIPRAYVPSNAPEVLTLPIELFAGFFDEIFFAVSQSANNVVAPSINLLIGGAVLWGLSRTVQLWRDPWFLACVAGALCSFAFAFGLVPPGLILQIPAIKAVRHIHNTFSCVLLIQSMVIAGFGIREFSVRASEFEWRQDLRIVVMFSMAIALACMSIPNRPPLSLFALAFLPTLLLGLLAVVWAARKIFYYGARPVSVRILIISLFILHARLGQQLETGFDQIDKFVFNPHQRVDFSKRSPTIDELPLDNGHPFRAVATDNALFPGYSASLGIENISGADPLMNPFYRELIVALGFHLEWGWKIRFSPQDVGRLSAALNMLNVRFLFYPPDSSQPPDSSTLSLARNDLTSVERPNAWPRAFFVDKLASYKDPYEFAKMVELAEGPFGAIDNRDRSILGLSTNVSPNIALPAVNYELTSNSTAFSVEAPTPGFAVLSEAFLANSFQVTLDGQPVEYFRVNHAFKGIAIPLAGRHKIVFTYLPPVFGSSLKLSIIGVLLLFAILLLPPVQKWRRLSIAYRQGLGVPGGANCIR